LCGRIFWEIAVFRRPQTRSQDGAEQQGKEKCIYEFSKVHIPRSLAQARPSKPPIKAWVVEIGKPKRVAKNTAKAAAPATLIIKLGVLATELGTTPRPENCCTKASAKNQDAKLPASVAKVAKIRACCQPKVSEPHTVAKPLKLSFAPLFKAKNKAIAIKINSIVVS
jgi:hypothetical protein